MGRECGQAQQERAFRCVVQAVMVKMIIKSIRMWPLGNICIGRLDNDAGSLDWIGRDGYGMFGDWIPSPATVEFREWFEEINT